MKTAVIVGGGKGGTALFKMLMESGRLKIIGIADINPSAPGLKKAEEAGISTTKYWKELLKLKPDMVIEATGEEKVFQQIYNYSNHQFLVIPAFVANVLYDLIHDKEQLIQALQSHDRVRSTILHSTHDGMIAINTEEKIILFNRAASEMTGTSQSQAEGALIDEILPESGLKRVMKTSIEETNRKLTFQNGRSIITTRLPLWEHGLCIGALAVFKDVTEIAKMAEEVTNLKSIQQMLESIIHSSEEAISVVDENGYGTMINPAYTRLTGLSEEEVIGKPAHTDISEGDSMHMQVLDTKKPVRGVRMKVGPKKKEVIVNVAPVIVDRKIKGSVGVLHDVSEIRTLTEELKRARKRIRTLEAKYNFEDIIGRSKEMQVPLEQAKLSAGVPVTVLLRGESGTGKELFAHAIHNASSRRFNKFIRVNCAAISESLLESELFGYEEGAFSGAKQGGKRGLIEEADKGSIFLDEIGEMSSSTQAKLLRVLQEGEIVKVGAAKSITIDVRVIAATNINLEKAVHENKFREDLYYRLNKMPIYIPSLRERKSDLKELCNHLLDKINSDFGRSVSNISDEVLDTLYHYDWPGNVRELENVLGRAVISMQNTDQMIKTRHLPPLRLTHHSNHVQTSGNHKKHTTLQEDVQAFEKNKIQEVLKDNQNNKTLTAKQLGISVRNLYYKLEKHKIEYNGMQ
ncbi:sigma-54 interaction domain-containing protein [Alteribacillus bidgolensis]|uniref:PAS domain S-box-containing protein n=1 Tax=Alteribacillus bidgolensis TaxID=930129 RepID=A0A1G8BSB7_9BACI|nr:sigma-54-dependent Fis family transcriptional regulator [Alteribacillus bidgolensis]SDH35988.1 PAS domain S-box-containing protein [Alteribacillus bidgolensis]